MSAFTPSEFASLLDDMIAKAGKNETPAPRPSMPFGYVGPSEAVEELWASVPEDFVASLYQETGTRQSFDETPGIQTPEPEAPLPPADPESIAAELGISHARRQRDFDRIRREFALANHPDRVEPRLRENALQRMQIANMLIDQAKQKASRRT